MSSASASGPTDLPTRLAENLSTLLESIPEAPPRFGTPSRKRDRFNKAYTKFIAEYDVVRSEFDRMREKEPRGFPWDTDTTQDKGQMWMERLMQLFLETGWYRFPHKAKWWFPVADDDTKETKLKGLTQKTWTTDGEYRRCYEKVFKAYKEKREADRLSKVQTEGQEGQKREESVLPQRWPAL